MIKPDKITVIGDGGWGTAIALLLHSYGHTVSVWGPFDDYIESIKATRENKTFLPDIEIPEDINWTSDPKAAIGQSADVVVLAIPTRFYRSVLETFNDAIPSSALVVSLTKGLDKTTHQAMTQVAEEMLHLPHIAALSGPSHAEEVARGIPTAVVMASASQEDNEVLQKVFSGETFRVYTSDDLLGVQLGGALKNVIAIAVGVSDGLGFGDNTRAALITRGLAEMTRLGCALGAIPSTFAGLSGMGDLIVTCTSKLSRNRMVGERVGKGEKIDDILGGMQQVAEGAWNCASALALAQEHNVDVPITSEVYAIIHEGKDPRHAVQSLLTREVRPE